MTGNEAEGYSPDARIASIELLSRGRLSKADGILSDAVRRDTATPLEKLEWIKSASVQGNHAEALQRLALAKSTGPGTDWWPVEAELLIRARNWQDAAACLGRVRGANAAGALHRKLTVQVETLRKIEDKAARDDAATRRPDGGYQTYCINLDEDEDKWSRCLREAAQAGLTLERMPGLKGSHIPDGLMARFGDRLSPRFKGTLGCFVSHFSCWESFLKSGAAHALILEDDFRAMIRFPAGVGGFGLPERFDICWLNWGMSSKESGGLGYVPVADVVLLRATPDWTANGGYGYLLSRDGAAKLVRQVSEDGLYGDVDWRMLAYSLHAGFMERLSPRSHARKAMEAHYRIVKPRTPLVSYAATIGLIGVESIGSARQRQNTALHYDEEP